LGEVSEVLTGPFGSLLHKSDYVSDGIPLINPINIVDGQIIVGTEKTVSRETLNRLRSYALSEGDIVFGRRGEIGRCAVVGPEQAGWLCGTGCFFIRRFLVRRIRVTEVERHRGASSSSLIWEVGLPTWPLQQAGSSFDFKMILAPCRISK
jgi:hypothetical protein